MGSDRRKNDRISFERGFPATMMGIDGTWCRSCSMDDASDSGGKLTVKGSVEGLDLKEFFLLLSSTGLAYRRCELSWLNGAEVGVRFLKHADASKRGAKGAAAAPPIEV